MQTPNEHTARRRGRFIVPVSLHNQIRIFTLSNPYIHFIAHVCPHFKIRIFKSPHTHFRSPFCGCFRICGHDKSAPTAADGLPITLRTHHETPNEHSARRRGRFIVPVSLHNQIYIFISPNTCFHIIEYIH